MYFMFSCDAKLSFPPPLFQSSVSQVLIYCPKKHLFLMLKTVELLNIAEETFDDE